MKAPTVDTEFLYTAEVSSLVAKAGGSTEAFVMFFVFLKPRGSGHHESEVESVDEVWFYLITLIDFDSEFVL